MVGSLIKIAVTVTKDIKRKLIIIVNKREFNGLSDFLYQEK